MRRSRNPPASRCAFTLKELLATVAVIGALCALALPFIQMARENARRNSCSSNLHIIGVALMNYENKHGCFPPISSNVDAIADIPGDATATSSLPSAKYSADSPAAGFSWAVWILPEIEEAKLYQAIVNNSRTFSDPAFSPAIVNGPSGNSARVATVQLGVFRCPSFSGGPLLDTSPRTIGTPAGTIETGSLPPNYLAAIATANGAAGIAITNYNAFLGTHIDDVGPAVPPYPLKSASLTNSNNGGMKFRGAVYDQGLRLADFPDGLRNTPLIAETRERRFSSWYDGTMNWVVAARHSNPAAGATAMTGANNTTTSVVYGQPLKGRWSIGTDGTPATGGVALNYGPSAENPTAVCLPTGALSDPDISSIPPGRLWGPSSQHSGSQATGGIVNHLYGDAHVEGIGDGIDPNVYLWIITRNAGEPTGGCCTAE